MPGSALLLRLGPWRLQSPPSSSRARLRLRRVVLLRVVVLRTAHAHGSLLGPLQAMDRVPGHLHAARVRVPPGHLQGDGVQTRDPSGPAPGHLLEVCARVPHGSLHLHGSALRALPGDPVRAGMRPLPGSGSGPVLPDDLLQADLLPGAELLQ